MADWSTPVLTSTYVSVLDSLKNRDIDAAVGFSPTYSSATNLPTGTIRWNPTNGYWEIRSSGGTWSALIAKYKIDVDKLDGQEGSYYLAWGNLTGVPSSFTPSAHTHDDRYFTETEADARFGNKLVTSGNYIKLQTPGNADLATIMVPYASNAGAVSGFAVGQHLLTTSTPTFAGLKLGATTIAATGTEINYLSGVTSAIQTQIDSKQDTITGAATSILSANLDASRVLVSDASGKVSVSSVTTTQLGYLSGVQSSIQTQLDGKAPQANPTFTGTLTGNIARLNGAALSLTSTTHSFQIGPTTSTNLVMDANDIQVRNDGVGTLLNINRLGGNVAIGSTGATVTVNGTLVPADITLPASSVLTSSINAGAVVNSKLADSAVTKVKIAADAVDNTKIDWAQGSLAVSTNNAGGGATFSIPLSTIGVWSTSGSITVLETAGTSSARKATWSTGGGAYGTVYWRYVA